MISKLPMRTIAYNQLIDWISNERMPVNSYLPAERELAEKFETSRVTIRQALDRLEEEGIVKREKNKRPLIMEIPVIDGEGTVPVPAPNKTGLIGFYSAVAFTEVMSQTNDLTNIVGTVITNLEKAGRHVAYVNTHLKDLGKESIWQSLVPNGLAGLFIQPPNGIFSVELGRMINQQDSPVVLIDGYADGFDVNASSVDLDNTAGVSSIVEYLASLGHQKIAFLTQNLDAVWVHQRRSGYQKGMAGITSLETIWTMPENHLEASQTSKIISEIKQEGITAVVTDNDGLAIEMKHLAIQEGLDVPGDLSIIGFDDNTHAMEERLTTVSHMAWEIAEKATEIMLKLLNNPNSNLIFRERITPKLIIRDSVAEPAK